MAYYTIEKDKKGNLYANVRVSFKDLRTGKHKITSKRIHNEEKLTEAKFKKFVEKEAYKFEEETHELLKEKAKDNLRVLTFNELANEWLAGIKRNLSINYYTRAKTVIEKFNIFLQEHYMDEKPISDIKVRDVQLFLNTTAEERKLRYPTYKLKKEASFDIPLRVKVKNNSWSMSEALNFCKKNKLSFEKDFEILKTTFQYSVTTIKGYRRILRTIFNEAIRFEWIYKNPVCYTKVTATGNNGTLRAITEKEVLSLDEIHPFLEALDRIKEIEPNRVIPIKIMLFAGLRNGEVHGLKWSDIDFNKKIIHVTRSRYYDSSVGVYEKDPKTKTSIRDVPIPDYLLKALNEYKEWFRIMDDNFDNKPDKYYLCVNLCREPIDPKNLNKWLKEFESKNNLRLVTCHGLRHTYCSMLLSQNVPIQTVSRYMGHSDSAVTLKVYSHFMPETQTQAVNALNNIIKENI
ncbi:MAG: site-specific integrase [Clostridia bacterium]|nr:site-specific integrase [Clostridia bacterium]